MKYATWIIRDEKFFNGLLPGRPDYGQVMLTSQTLVCAFTMNDHDNRDKIIKAAKRQLINDLLKDLMETEDWFEEN